MANQGTPKNRARLESEIERNREEGNWDRSLDLAQQLNADQPELAHFLTGEAKLEKYLASGKQADTTLLNEAKRHIEQCLEGSTNSSPLAMDANLLLAKLFYVSAEYGKALRHIELSGIDNISSVEKQLPLRVMKLVAESLAVKGMSLEHQHPNDIYETRIASLTKATDLAIRYMQNVKEQQGYLASYATLGNILEMCIQRAPIVYIKTGQLNQACHQYRAVMNACETPSTYNTRQILSRQLAELILRGISRMSWNKSDLNLSTPTKPLKPQRYIGHSLFVPKEREEEIVLLLLISEMLAARNVVLDRSQEYKEARTQTIENVIAIYDLLAITLTPLQCYYTDVYERAMKFSFQVKHIWFQFALTLMESGKSPLRSLLLLKEVARIDAQDPLPSLLAAKLCIQELDQFEEALELAMESLERCEDEMLKPKIHLIIGISHALIYENSTETVKKRKLDHLNESIKHLQKASANTCDNLPYFHLALHMARQRAINDAIQNARISLSLNPQHLPTIQLLILCLSSFKHYQEALVVCEAALEEYPGHLLLLYIKAHLEEAGCENGRELALLTAKEMLNNWSLANTDKRKQNQYNFQSYFVPFNYDSVSLKMEQSLSEVTSLASEALHQADTASSVFAVPSSNAGASNRQMWTIQIHIWLLIIELFIKLGQISEAESCVTDGSVIFGSLSHQMMYIKGILCKAKGHLLEAKAHLQNCISINPKHGKALQQLGHTYFLLGNHSAADKYLKDSLNVDATLHETWSYAGLVLQATNDEESAVDCQMTGLELETSAPVIPFSIIPRAVLD